MIILATMPTGMGGNQNLVKYSNDFYAYGTESELNSFLGVSVNKCGTKKKVSDHLKSLSNLCEKHIAKFQKELSKEKKNPKGWEMIIDMEQNELDMILHFLKVLTKEQTEV